MATAEEWSRAYAQQAAADFNTYQVLEGLPVNYQEDNTVPNCHRLQFLQMACEKLAKAHLCAAGTSPNLLQSSHAWISKTLPVVIRQEAAALKFSGNHARSLFATMRHLAQEIELLAPAVKRGGQHPDNCEYPWEDNEGKLHIPLSWTFYPSGMISQPAGHSILKLIHSAIVRLLKQL